MELIGKNVLITGSTRGIGKAIAAAFAKEGANIALNGRKPIRQDLIAEMSQYGGKCIGVEGDIAQFEEAGNIIAAVESELGSIDILVNNAGITKDKLLLRMSEEDFTACIQVNLTGTFNMIQQSLRKMFKQRSGTIINLSSVSGLIGNIGQANYSASKAGVIGLTKTVAREAAPRGITCNAIAPGFIDTEMTEVLSENIKEQMKNQIPLKNFGRVEDIAEAAIFLAKNQYITGQVINVDGGLVMNG